MAISPGIIVSAQIYPCAACNIPVNTYMTAVFPTSNDPDVIVFHKLCIPCGNAPANKDGA